MSEFKELYDYEFLIELNEKQQTRKNITLNALYNLNDHMCVMLGRPFSDVYNLINMENQA
jgi:hypothetical protein